MLSANRSFATPVIHVAGVFHLVAGRFVSRAALC